MEQRKRINAKQTAKGEWQIDATVEWTGDDADISTGKMDNGNVSLAILGLIKTVESDFQRDDRKLAGGAA